MAFNVLQALPGVWHIQDSMGVCMTLLEGAEQALLIDTGYGLEDVSACVRTLTSRPLRVMLTHGHHDHALGARWFPHLSVLPEDFPVYRTYTGERWRRHVLEGARSRGIGTDEAAFLSAPVPEPDALAEECLDLGGLTARVIRCPGHTPGSAAVYVPERSLLITGDSWNPCTWVFFPEALSVQAWRDNLRALLRIPRRHVLCSHHPALLSGDQPAAFLEGITDRALEAAEPSGAGDSYGIRTAQVSLPGGQVLVFDREKYSRQRQNTGA